MFLKLTALEGGKRYEELYSKYPPKTVYVYSKRIICAKNGEFDVIIQGCNCFHTMGAGIAKYIKQDFPEAFAADKQFEDLKP